MKQNSGLTYLELLVVMVLLSITSVLIGGAFDFVRQTRERAMVLENAEEGILLRGLLRAWIEDMSPQASKNEFVGSNSSFSFVLNGRLDFLPQASRVEISFVADPQLSKVPALVDISGIDREGSNVFQDSREFETELEFFNLSYYGSHNNQPAAWHEAWAGNRLPELIKFEATRSSGAPMPPFIVQPSVTYNQSLISAFFPSPPT